MRGLLPDDGESVAAADPLQAGGHGFLDAVQLLMTAGFSADDQAVVGRLEGAASPGEVNAPRTS
jgi:hypothetical protein